MNNATHVIGCIYDNKSEIYLRPFLFRTNGEFIRNVQMEAKNPDSMLHKFPSDYELHLIGHWNESEGIIGSDQMRLGSVLDLCPLS